MPVDERGREHATTCVDRAFRRDISQFVAFANKRNTSITHDHRRVLDHTPLRIHSDRELRAVDFQ